MIGGLASGVLLGLIGTAISYAIASSSSPEVGRVPEGVEGTCYRDGYVARAKSMNTTNALTGGLIGCVSAVMGIGGGTLTVPTLNLCGYPIHRAVGTSAFFGIFISIPGTLGYLLARPPAGLPWATVGFVSLVGLAVIAPGSMLTATLGARVAHTLSRRRLSQAFGVFLLIVGTRMLYRALS